jgi:hypothetical protein
MSSAIIVASRYVIPSPDQTDEVSAHTASAPSHHDLFLAAFITDIAGSDFQHTG